MPGRDRTSGRASSLWQHRDFHRYWGGQAISVTGGGITAIGISVIAVVDLHASTMHVAVIAFCGGCPTCCSRYTLACLPTATARGRSSSAATWGARQCW